MSLSREVKRTLEYEVSRYVIRLRAKCEELIDDCEEKNSNYNCPDGLREHHVSKREDKIYKAKELMDLLDDLDLVENLGNLDEIEELESELFPEKKRKKISRPKKS